MTNVMARSSEVCRRLLVVALALGGALACTTKSVNTTAISYGGDGGTSRAGRSPGVVRTFGHGRRGSRPLSHDAARDAEGARRRLPLRDRVRDRRLRGRRLLLGRGLRGPAAAGRGLRGDSECQSSFCADGVCCNVACTGACVACTWPTGPANARPSRPAPRTATASAAATRPRAAGRAAFATARAAAPNTPPAPPASCRAASARTGSCRPACATARASACAAWRCPAQPSTCEGGTCRNSCTASDQCMAPAELRRRQLRSQGQRPGLHPQRPVPVRTPASTASAARTPATGKCTFCANPDARGRCLPVRAGRGRPAGGARRGRPEPDLRRPGPRELRHQRPLRRQRRLPGLPRRHRLPRGQLRLRGQHRDAGRHLRRRLLPRARRAHLRPLPGLQRRQLPQRLRQRRPVRERQRLHGGRLRQAPRRRHLQPGQRVRQRQLRPGALLQQRLRRHLPLVRPARSRGRPARTSPPGGADPAGTCRNDACGNGCDGVGRLPARGGRVAVRWPASCGGNVRRFDVCSALGRLRARTQSCAGGTPVCTADGCVAPEPKGPGERCVRQAECRGGLSCARNGLCCDRRLRWALRRRLQRRRQRLPGAPVRVALRRRPGVQRLRPVRGGGSLRRGELRRPRHLRRRRLRLPRRLHRQPLPDAAQPLRGGQLRRARQLQQRHLRVPGRLPGPPLRDAAAAGRPLRGHQLRRARHLCRRQLQLPGRLPGQPLPEPAPRRSLRRRRLRATTAPASGSLRLPGRVPGPPLRMVPPPLDPCAGVDCGANGTLHGRRLRVPERVPGQPLPEPAAARRSLRRSRLRGARHLPMGRCQCRDGFRGDRCQIPPPANPCRGSTAASTAAAGSGRCDLPRRVPRARAATGRRPWSIRARASIAARMATAPRAAASAGTASAGRAAGGAARSTPAPTSTAAITAPAPWAAASAGTASGPALPGSRRRRLPPANPVKT